MPKAIIVFSDGTGQAGGLTPDENVSNIYKLFRATRCGPDSDIDPSEQLTFYDPGLGSQPESGVFGAERAYRWVHNLLSQAIASFCSALVAEHIRFAVSLRCFHCAACRRLWRTGRRPSSGTSGPLE